MAHRDLRDHRLQLTHSAGEGIDQRELTWQQVHSSPERGEFLLWVSESVPLPCYTLTILTAGSVESIGCICAAGRAPSTGVLAACPPARVPVAIAVTAWTS